MARPAKPISQHVGHRMKKEIEGRTAAEAKFRGDTSQAIRAPASLTPDQKKHFRFVVKELEAAETLGKLDVPLLVQYARCKDRLDSIEQQIDEDSALLLDKEVAQIQDRYFKQLARLINELGLSPQSRAKLAISLTKNDKPQTIADILGAEDDGQQSTGLCL